jgi:glycine dehydrogenase subunit 1
VRTIVGAENVVVVPAVSGRVDAERVARELTAETAALVLAYPNFFGIVDDGLPGLCAKAREAGALSVVCAEPLSLALLTPPGEWGADVCVGEGQPLGVSLSFGGPVVGFFACKKDLVRRMPGRLAGQTVDGQGRRGFVLTLQTREQHIRREKATSNICTNQALVALMVNIFMTVYGKVGLKELAKQNLAKTAYAAAQFARHGKVLFAGTPRFNEFVVQSSEDPYAINGRLLGHKMVGGLPLKKFYPELGNAALWCCTELTTRTAIDTAVGLVAESERSVRSSKEKEEDVAEVAR